MSLDRRAFIAKLLAGAAASLVLDMIVEEPLTTHGIKEFIHPHPADASHTASVFLKRVGGDWEYHIFPVDIKVTGGDKQATHLRVETGLSAILDGREHEFVAGYGFDMHERKIINGGQA